MCQGLQIDTGVNGVAVAAACCQRQRAIQARVASRIDHGQNVARINVAVIGQHIAAQRQGAGAVFIHRDAVGEHGRRGIQSRLIQHNRAPVSKLNRIDALCTRAQAAIRQIPILQHDAIRRALAC